MYQQQSQYGQQPGMHSPGPQPQYLANMGSPAAFSPSAQTPSSSGQGYFPQGQQHQQENVSQQFEQMALSPGSQNAPSRAKRSARAYHHDANAATLQAQHQPDMPPQHANSQYQQSQGQFNQSQSFQQQQQQDPRYAQVANSHGNLHEAPPHAAGQQAKLNPSGSGRIDVDQIPSPIAVQAANQHKLDAEAEGMYYTCSRMEVPLSTTQFVAVDQGNATPRFVRMTTYALPATDDLASSSNIPIGMVIQPFAQSGPGEEPVQCVDFGEAGPPRCKDCRAYINPWCIFLEGGQKFACNLCESVTDVPPEYFSHLDTSGRRLDLDDRLELQRGSIDFAVPKEYWVQLPSSTPSLSALSAHPPSTPSLQSKGDPLAKPQVQSVPGSRTPEPLCYVFAIDVSWTAAQSGMIREVAGGIRDILYGAENENGERLGGSLPPGARVGLITFDRTVHFYNLQAGLDQAQMLVVGDILDMFVPINEGLLVDPEDSRPAIEHLLTSLDTLFAQTQIAEAALGAAIKACQGALPRSELQKYFGGQANIFQTSLPTIGPGSLKHREDSKLYGTDKERTLFTAQDPFYRQAGEECVDAGIGLNLFLFPSQYVDVASIGVLTGLTGGEIYFHPRFDPVRDGRTVRAEMKGLVERETACSVTMRIRCSNGLRISDHFGNFFQRNVTDLEFGTVDSDKAVAAIIKHDGKLDEKREAYFQCAVLYTSAFGERRVRCHNIAVPVSSKLGDVFRLADMDATIAIVAKEAITQTLSKTLRDVRDGLTDQCVKALLSYRKHCASATSPGQLILPESYKLFPLFALGLMKTKALKGGPVASDVRTYYMRIIKAISVASVVELLYPKFFPLHALHPEDATYREDGRFQYPPQLRTSYQRMEAHGAYLVINGETAILWLGAGVSPQILQDLYGVGDLNEIDKRMTALPRLPTLLSEQVRALLDALQIRQRHRSLPILIARQQMDGTEMEFANLLVEDANNDALGYADYLCLCHKQIQSSLLGEKREAEIDSSSLWRGW